MFPRGRTQRIILIVSALLLCNSVFALDPKIALTQYVHNSWGPDEGLHNTAIYDIIQTRDGYLWFATLGGLIRFDGVRFETFEPSNTKEMKGVQCYALLESPDGTLWIGTYLGGLLAYKDGKFRAYGKQEGLLDDRVLALYQDRSGTLWLGTPTALFRMRDGKFKMYPEKEVWAMLEDRGGTFWVGTIGGGLFRLRNDKLERFAAVDTDGVYALLEDQRQNFWVGSVDGLYRIQNGKITKYKAPRIAGDLCLALTGDRNGNLWIGTTNGLTRFHNETFESMSTKNGLPGDLVGAIYEDQEENLWIGTNGGSVSRFRNGKFLTFSKEEGLSNETIGNIHGNKKGDLWFANERAVARMRNGKVENFFPDKSIAQWRIITVMEDSRGTVWVAIDGAGLHILRDGKFELFSKTDKLLGAKPATLFEDRPGSLWVTNFAFGINHLENGRVKAKFTEKEGLTSTLVRAFSTDKEGNLLVLSEDAGILRYHDGKFSVFASKEMMGNDIWSVFRDNAGVYWIGSNGGGLKRLENGKLVAIQKQHGLPDDVIGDVLEDDTGNFWISSSKGIFRVSKKEINDFAAGKTKSVHCTLFGKPDGMETTEMQYGLQPSAWKASDGKLWFPSIKGAVMIDPANLKTNPVRPPVYIEKIVIDDQPFDPPTPDTIDFSPGKKNFEFHYTALSFRVPERVRFRYKLEGYDENWHEANTRRIAYYTNLPPRSYRFRVTACNDDNVWNEAGASLSFRLEPFFYQTTWFYGLTLLIAIGAAAGLYRARVNALKARGRQLTVAVEEKTAELRHANAKLIEAQERIANLLESQPQALENIPAWSQAAANDIARVVGVSSISVWVRRDEELHPWTSNVSDDPPTMEDLKKAIPFSLTQTERIILPVNGANGEIYGALTVSGKHADWGDTERHLILGFANQLGSTLEMQRMRQDLATVRQKVADRIKEYTDKGVATLQVCPHCSRCFDHTAPNCPFDGAALRTPQILPYRIQDRYRMIRLLGTGGTGTVFHAEDEKLNRYVAVKIIHRDPANQQNRWEREARTIARLHHPGIVNVYDVGELESGIAFLIMEFLQGTDMARRLHVEGPGRPAQVALLLEQVGDALTSAHNAGVIHRDLKPANLFMIASAEGFKIKVVDFGLAKLLHEDQTITRTGIVVGSPFYMSPEQIRGEKLDGRSDLFSLAVVAYELITGNPAFYAQTVPDVLVRIAADHPAPFSKYFGAIDPALQQTFDWALEKDREQRPASIAEWLQQSLSLIERISSPATGWNTDDLGATLDSPPDPDTPTARV